MLFPRRVCFHTAPSAKSCLLATRNEAKTQLRIGPIQLRRVSLKAYHQVRSGCPNKFPTDFLSNIPPQYLQIPITGSWQRLCLVNFGKESGWQMRKWNRLKTPGWIERKRYYSFIQVQQCSWNEKASRNSEFMWRQPNKSCSSRLHLGVSPNAPDAFATSRTCWTCSRAHCWHIYELFRWVWLQP